ncbi:MAG TPA: class I SAM-dependent methyltransferase [Holophagaceae bacterium]|jgi:SAM-dependent methyltransferase|nr:class I SAM-dependent methyltransferase [Holophagaceae bacterium]
MRRFLSRPWLYKAFKKVVVSEKQMERFVAQAIQPEANSRILDIGCGPADIVAFLPSSCAYIGFDANPDYIEDAKRAHPQRKDAFSCQMVKEATLVDPGTWDIVMANGVIHHLDDGEALQLFAIARKALRPGGRLVTLDGVYTPDQSWAARWLISRDRGRFVRTQAEYEDLARQVFDRVEPHVEQDYLRIPYTHLVLTCWNGDEA